ncbi:MAG: hypothetical protein JJU03_04910, partial [Idiomarina sp.]|nr:hypothetical protein [Idiomarina sp.]
TLVAIMTQWLYGKMRTLERGLTPVSLRRHITVLGWNSRTLPILLDILGRGPLAESRDSKRVPTRISVLADDITEGPTTEFNSNQELARQRKQVILRSGSMLNPEHLHRVAAANARVVIIPSHANSADALLTADAEAIKVLLSLNAQRAADQLPLAIVELQSADKIPLALHSYRGRLQLVASDVAIARAFSQSVVNPGVSDVLDYLLVDANGCQLYLTSATPLEGKVWADVSEHYHAAIPCGLVRQNGEGDETILVPAADTRIAKSDLLVLLANEERDIVFVPADPALEAPLPPAQWVPRQTSKQPRSILILGWNARVAKFIEQVAEATQGVLNVTSVSTMSHVDRRAQVEHIGDHWQFIEADYTRPSILAKQPLGDYDSILVFATDRLNSGEEADARSIVTNQLLDYLLSEQEKRPQVVVELTDPNNAVYVSASKHKLRSEVVQSSAMISHLLAQLAVFPQLRSVYDDLLDPEGAGLHLRRVPQSWHGEHYFRQLQRAVTAEGVILLGVKQGSERSQLNLPPNTLVPCNEDTLLVIMG